MTHAIIGRRRLWALMTPLILLCWPNNALALQGHGNIEGLYVHQAAHLFFAVSMMAFALMVKDSRVMNQKAAKCLSSGAVLLAAWNIWAFSGHLVELFVPAAHVAVAGPSPTSTPSLYMAGWKEVLYYVLKMDHLLCVPALVCFYLGIKASERDFDGTIKNRNGTSRTTLSPGYRRKR